MDTQDTDNSLQHDWNQLTPALRAEWSKRLDVLGLLPAFSSHATPSLALTSFEPRELALRVAQDPVLGGKILSAVNSARFGLSVRVTSIQRAIVHLGFNLVKTIIVAHEMEAVFSHAPDYPPQYLSFIRRWAAVSSVLAFHWAQAEELTDPSTASTLALLSRLGPLALGLGQPVPDQAYLDLPDEISRLRHGHATWGVTSPMLAAELARRWDLPEPLPQMLSRQAEPHLLALSAADDRMLCLAAASTLLARHCMDEPETACSEPLDEPDAAQLKSNLASLHMLDGLSALWSAARLRRELAAALDE